MRPDARVAPPHKAVGEDSNVDPRGLKGLVAEAVAQQVQAAGGRLSTMT